MRKTAVIIAAGLLAGCAVNRGAVVGIDAIFSAAIIAVEVNTLDGAVPISPQCPDKDPVLPDRCYDDPPGPLSTPPALPPIAPPPPPDE
jgi:hypothetical protein